MDKEALGLSEMIQKGKNIFIHNLTLILNNPQAIPKTYWSIIKLCCNGRKIPIIPPRLVDGKFLTNLKEKTSFFNKYFSSQYNPSPEDSKLPENQAYITETKLPSFDLDMIYAK